MKKILLFILTYVLVTGGVATGMVVISPNSKGPTTNDSTSSVEEEPPTPPTPSELFLGQLVAAGNIAIDAEITITQSADPIASVVLDGEISLEDFTNIQVAGDLSLSTPWIDLEAEIAYLSNYLYLGTDFLHAKVETSSAISGLSNLLPLFGVELNMNGLSSIMGSLDVDDLLVQLSTLEFTPAGDLYQGSLTLMSLITIQFYVDADYRLQRVVLVPFTYGGMTITLEAETELLGVGNGSIVSPESDEVVYDDFTSIFALIESAHQLSQQKQFALTMQAEVLQQSKKALGLTADVVLDLTKNDFAVALNASAKEKEYAFSAQYRASEGLYFSLQDLFKGKLSGGDITQIQTIVEGYLGTDIVTFITTKVQELLTSETFSALTAFEIKDLLATFEQVSYDGEVLSLDLDLSSLMPTMGTVTLKVASKEGKIKGLHIEDLVYEDYSINLSLDLQEYQGLPSIDESEYEDYAPLLTIYDEIMALTNQEEFAFNVGLQLETTSKTYNINGFVQFALHEKLDEESQLMVPDYSAYVALTINDGVKDHSLKMELDQETLYFAYNDKMYGQITISTIKDIVSQISELLASDNPLLAGITGLIPSQEELSVIGQIMQGNYQALSLDLLKSFSVGSDSLEVVLSADVLQTQNDWCLAIGYQEDKLTSLSISDLQMGGINLSLTAQFADYGERLSLDKTQNYLDLNTLNTLLHFGLGTMESEYYMMEGSATINLMSIYTLSIPLEAKIHNNQGKPEIYIHLASIPIFEVLDYVLDYGNKIPAKLKENNNGGSYMTPNLAIYDRSSNRSADIYIADGNAYIMRQETAHFHRYVGGTAWPASRDETYIRAVKVPVGDFLQNISYYLFSTVLGFNDKLMAIINEQMTMLPVEEMKIDELLTGMTYSESESRFSYDLNIAALTGNDSAKSTILSIYHTTTGETDHLSAVALSMKVTAVVNIYIDIALNLVNFGTTFDPQFITDFAKNYPYATGVEYYSHSA